MIYRLKISCGVSTFPGQKTENPEFHISDKSFIYLCIIVL